VGKEGLDKGDPEKRRMIISQTFLKFKKEKIYTVVENSNQQVCVLSSDHWFSPLQKFQSNLFFFISWGEFFPLVPWMNKNLRQISRQEHIFPSWMLPQPKCS